MKPKSSEHNTRTFHSRLLVGGANFFVSIFYGSPSLLQLDLAAFDSDYVIIQGGATWCLRIKYKEERSLGMIRQLAHKLQIQLFKSELVPANLLFQSTTSLRASKIIKSLLLKTFYSAPAWQVRLTFQQCERWTDADRNRCFDDSRDSMTQEGCLTGLQGPTKP